MMAAAPLSATGAGQELLHRCAITHRLWEKRCLLPPKHLDRRISSWGLFGFFCLEAAAAVRVSYIQWDFSTPVYQVGMAAGECFTATAQSWNPTI
jgi:hypothetical protein